MASKLNLDEFQEWVSLELNGYDKTQEKLPDYRKVTGSIQAWNPYHGWTPAIFQNEKQQKLYSTGNLLQPAGELESIVNEHKQGPIPMSLRPEMVMELMNSMPVSLKPSLILVKPQFQGVLDAIRNIILEWSLKLEKQGIHGGGMTFSKEEKKVAATTVFNIQSMSHSQIQSETVRSTQSMTTQGFNINQVREIINSLKPNVDQFDLDAQARAQLLSDIQTVEPQLAAPKPSKSIIKECMHSIRTIMEGASGNLLASSVLSNINLLLTHFTS